MGQCWDRAMLAVLPAVHGAERNLEVSRQLLLGDVAGLTNLAHKGYEVNRSVRRDRSRHLLNPDPGKLGVLYEIV
jgi:hypothetical protein